MNLRQGEIYWVSFPASDGREQAGQRPALIVQGDAWLQSLPTVWVVLVTSNLQAARFPGTMRIDPDQHNGLTVPSILLIFQLRAIDKRRLLNPAGTLSSPQLAQVLQMVESLLGR
jgi:mRNA interferase MazF